MGRRGPDLIGAEPGRSAGQPDRERDVERARGRGREQVRQGRIDNRRRSFDEYLYERERRPSQEDERERARLENLRRSRNDPPITEIWSGLATPNRANCEAENSETASILACLRPSTGSTLRYQFANAQV